MAHYTNLSFVFLYIASYALYYRAFLLYSNAQFLSHQYCSIIALVNPRQLALQCNPSGQASPSSRKAANLGASELQLGSQADSQIFAHRAPGLSLTYLYVYLWSNIFF